jgi:Uma2 family endonuclease
MIAPEEAPGFGDSELLAPGVLLAAEVVSPSSRRQDWQAKSRAYAQGGIPLYLLIDFFADPPAVTLFSRPGDAGYASRETATAGQALRLPDPFGIRLDVARLLG